MKQLRGLYAQTFFTSRTTLVFVPLCLRRHLFYRVPASNRVLTVQANVAFHFAERVLGDTPVRTNVALLEIPYHQHHPYFKDRLADHVDFVLVARNHHLSWNQ